MKKGFTLVELLVVIAVIGILAALLLPALSTVQEKGNQVKCKANLSQIGKALKVYFQDYGKSKKYPEVNGGGFIGYTYTNNILRERQVFVCPSTADETPTDTELNTAFKDKTGDNGTDSNNVISYAGRRNDPQKKYPGIYRLFRDTTTTAVGSDDWQGDAEVGNHEDGDLVNFLFLDAHVENIRIPNAAEESSGDQGYSEFTTKEGSLAHPLTN